MSLLQAAHASTPYRAALAYAELGLSVLPCTGKTPALPYWRPLQTHAATPTAITRWYQSGLLTNVGIICGKVSGGLVVIDLDGTLAVEAFQVRFPQFLNTYTVTSGSGHGLHLYFECDPVPPTTRVVGTPYGNVELRADGCYVVAPPSIHPSGRPYSIFNAAAIMRPETLRPVVEWIKALMREKHGGTLPPPANAGQIVHKTAYGVAALRGEAADVARAGIGERNDRLYRAALKMGSLIADGKIDRSSVERALFAAAAALSQTDGEGATLRTIASGINRGLESSRERHKHA